MAKVFVESIRTIGTVILLGFLFLPLVGGILLVWNAVRWLYRYARNTLEDTL
jgi:hypothetical protein